MAIYPGFSRKHPVCFSLTSCHIRGETYSNRTLQTYDTHTHKETGELGQADASRTATYRSAFRQKGFNVHVAYALRKPSST